MVRTPKHSPAAAPDELETVAQLRIALRRFLAATDQVTAANGLTPRQYDLLALLHRPRTEGELNASDIADSLALSRSAVTELLTRAVDAGLVTRESAEADMRVKFLAPTEEGSRRFLAAVDDLRTDRERLLRLLRTAAVLAATLNSVL
jgi:DNA-binding MarR family transcriptional regulator